MNDDTRQDTQQDSRDMVGELIRRAGRREHPSADEYERVLAAATDALRAKVGQRRRRVMFRSLAAAIVVGMAVTIIVANLPRPYRQSLAQVDRIAGPAEVRQDNEAWAELTGEQPVLTAGSRIRTGPGSRLGVRMTNGVSLRLAESTDVEFTGPRRVRLLSGKIYADAGESPPKDASAVPRIMVETSQELAWDVGTQFEVRYVNENYRLRVREGLVNLQQEARMLRGMAGEQLTIDTARRVYAAHIARDDAQWQWTESVAPDPVIDARPVSVLLNWVARQTGRSIVYARPELMLEADTTMLYGRVYDLEPLEALDAMLATTDFDYTLLEDGTILVDSRLEKTGQKN